MENAAMGRVVVPAKIENLMDRLMAGRGQLPQGEVPEDCRVLIGQVPLELMDWVVDSKGQRLVGNPEHGGEWMSDMF